MRSQNVHPDPENADDSQSPDPETCGSATFLLLADDPKLCCPQDNPGDAFQVWFSDQISRPVADSHESRFHCSCVDQT